MRPFLSRCAICAAVFSPFISDAFAQSVGQAFLGTGDHASGGRNIDQPRRPRPVARPAVRLDIRRKPERSPFIHLCLRDPTSQDTGIRGFPEAPVNARLLEY